MREVIPFVLLTVVRAHVEGLRRVRVEHIVVHVVIRPYTRRAVAHRQVVVEQVALRVNVAPDVHDADAA